MSCCLHLSKSGVSVLLQWSRQKEQQHDLPSSNAVHSCDEPLTDPPRSSRLSIRVVSQRLDTHINWEGDCHGIYHVNGLHPHTMH